MPKATAVCLVIFLCCPCVLYAQGSPAPVPPHPQVPTDKLELGTGKVEIVYDTIDSNQSFFRLSSMPDDVTWFGVSPSSSTGKRIRDQVIRAAAENWSVGAYSQDDGLVRAFFVYPASPRNSHTRDDARRARQETRQFIGANANEFGLEPGEISQLDLTYITSDLLDEYRQFSEKKDVAGSASERESPATAESASSFCYYGHHFVWDASTRTGYWKNSNYSSGCDAERHRCWGNKAWRAELSNMRVNPATCPRNSQGYGTITFKGS